ncbi:MAG: class I SAM-dependent methyltransferase [Bacteroidota bacterium]
MILRQKLFQIAEYFHYWLSQVDEHSLQAPFIYDLYTQAILGVSGKQPDLEQLRFELERNSNFLQIKDFGAGSITGDNDRRQVSAIAKNSISTSKTAKLVARIAAYFKPLKIIELGTSLGLTTLAINRSNPDADIYTIEGAPSIYSLAKAHFQHYGNGRINPFEGNIDHLLPEIIKGVSQVDLAIIDANHTEEATLSYFYTLLKCCQSSSVVILDDIHWSKGMKAAWIEIYNHPEVTCSIDLYQIGIVLFKPELSKQHWTLKF